MLTIGLIILALFTFARWLYHMPERQEPKNPWCATRKEPRP